tara:strand:+ start:778 stop:942 length:165 start_codon:yes stop_codon:yes gene_type:complete
MNSDRKKKTNQGKENQEKGWGIWAFVICLNLAGLLGAIYLQSKGIDVFAFRAGS